jgi:hypothetical protein
VDRRLHTAIKEMSSLGRNHSDQEKIGEHHTSTGISTLTSHLKKIPPRELSQTFSDAGANETEAARTEKTENRQTWGQRK